jgi:hypothetical protein
MPTADAPPAATVLPEKHGASTRGGFHGSVKLFLRQLVSFMKSVRFFRFLLKPKAVLDC